MAHQKLGLLLLLVTLSLPALTSATFAFSIAAAPVAVGVSAAAASQLAFLGVIGIGAKLGYLAGLSIGRKLVNRGKPRRWYRGKREIDSVNEVYNSLLSEIDLGKTEGCFQRLLCDVAARPVEFGHTLPIATSVELSSKLSLGPQATAVSRHLLEAINFGKKLQQTSVGAAYCEQVYNACPWTGQQLDAYIAQYRAMGRF